MSKIKRFFAYGRVSTSKQKYAETIENQVIAINQFASYNTDRIDIMTWFKDDGVSAFKQRPQYDEMLKQLDKCDGIIVSKMSRLGRTTKDLLELVAKFKENNKDLIFVKDSIDTTTPQGMFFFTIMAAMNEYEASVIRERCEEGKERARANGVKFGRKELEFDQKTLNQMKKQYENGVGSDSLAKIYGCSKSSCRNLLRKMGVKLRPPKGRVIAEGVK